MQEHSGLMGELSVVTVFIQEAGRISAYDSYNCGDQMGVIHAKMRTLEMRILEMRTLQVS